MVAQGEQGQEGIDLDIESMAQDEITMQELSPQPNAELIMGAGAAAFDTPPPRPPSSFLPDPGRFRDR